MTKMGSLAFKFLWRRKIRSSLILIGITLSVAFTVSIATVLDSIYLDFASQARNDSYADIAIITTGYEYFSMSTMENLSSLRAITITPSIFLSYEISTPKIQTTLIVLGIDPQTNPDYKYANIIEGRRSLSGNEILVSERAAQQFNLHVGQIIPLPLEAALKKGVSPETYVIISGIFRHPNFNNVGNHPVILLNLNFAQEYLKKEGQINRIVITVSNILKVYEVATKIQAVVGGDYNVITYTQFNRGDALIVMAYRAALNIIIILTILIEFVFLLGMLIINVSDQMREFGIFKTIGASNKEILEFLLTQLFFLGFLGAIFGLVLGRLLAFALVSYFGNLVEVWRTPPVTPLTFNYFALAFLIGMVVTVISGLYPISLALHMPNRVMIYERSFLTLNTYVNKNQWKIWTKRSILLAGALGFVGVILSYQTKATQLLEVQIFSLHYVAIFSFLLAIMLFQVVVTMRFLPLLAKKTIHKFLAFALATRDLSRNIGRSTLTMIAITLSLTFLLLISILINSLAIGVPQWYSTSFGIDVVADTGENRQAPLPLFNKIKQLYFVDTAFFVQEVKTPISTLDSIRLFGIKSNIFAKFNENFMEQGNSSVFNHLSVIYLVPNSDFILTKNETIPLFSLRHELSAYQTINVSKPMVNADTIPTKYSVVIPTILSSFYAQDQQIPLYSLLKAHFNSSFSFYLYIMGIIRSNFFLPSFSYSYIETNIMQGLLGHTKFRYVYIKLKDSQKASIVEIERRMNRIYRFSQVKMIEYVSKQIREGIKRQQIFLQTLLSEALLLATLSQFFMLLVSSLHMSYDIALLRTMGVSKQDVFRIFFFQSLLLMGISVIYSIFNALFGATVFLFYFNVLGAHIPLIIPIDQIFFWLLFYLVILVLTAKIPATGSAEREINEILTGRNISIKAIITAHPNTKAFIKWWKDKGWKRLLKDGQKIIMKFIQAAALLMLPLLIFPYFIWKTRRNITIGAEYRKPLLIFLLLSLLITVIQFLIFLFTRTSVRLTLLLGPISLQIPTLSALLTEVAIFYVLHLQFKKAEMLPPPSPPQQPHNSLLTHVKENPLKALLATFLITTTIILVLPLWHFIYTKTLFIITTELIPEIFFLTPFNPIITVNTNNNLFTIILPLLVVLAATIYIFLFTILPPLLIFGLIFYFIFIPGVNHLTPKKQRNKPAKRAKSPIIIKWRSSPRFIVTTIVKPFLSIFTAQIILTLLVTTWILKSTLFYHYPNIVLPLLFDLTPISDPIIYPLFFFIVTIHIVNTKDVEASSLADAKQRFFKTKIKTQIHDTKTKGLKNHTGFLEKFS